MIHIRNNQSRIVIVSRLVVALAAIAAILLSAFPSGTQVQRRSTARLNEDQRILHVLNRLGFGARPGDVERVKAMGLENYITQQLNPEKINDAVADAKVKDLPTLSMSTAELYEKYPQPGQLLRQLERRGELPKDLAAARDNRVKGGANAGPNAGDAKKNGEAMAPEALPGETAKNPAPPANP